MWARGARRWQARAGSMPGCRAFSNCVRSHTRASAPAFRDTLDTFTASAPPPHTTPPHPPVITATWCHCKVSTRTTHHLTSPSPASPTPAAPRAMCTPSWSPASATPPRWPPRARPTSAAARSAAPWTLRCGRHPSRASPAGSRPGAREGQASAAAAKGAARACAGDLHQPLPRAVLSPVSAASVPVDASEGRHVGACVCLLPLAS